MFFLADFSVIKPDFGLIFWTTVIFGLFWFLIGKFSFRPIAEALKAREHDIQSALDEAKRARAEMENLQAKNEELIQEAREERAKLLSEAKDTKNNIIKEAREKAKEEASKIVEGAQREIENQKNAAMAEVKSEVGAMAIEIAEKVLRNSLSSDQAQQSLVKDLVDQMSKN